MNDTDKKLLDDHNRRVKDAAKRMPNKGLHDSFRAIGHRAKFATSNDRGCMVNMSMGAISRLSKRYGYYRSVRSLWRDLKTFESNGIAIREPGERRADGTQEPGLIMLRFDVDYHKPEHDAYRQSEARTEARKPPRVKHEPNELPNHCDACLALYPDRLAAYVNGDLTDDDIKDIYDVHRAAIRR